MKIINETEGSTNGDGFAFEETDRDKVSEKNNIAWGMSMRGRFITFYTRSAFQLRKIINRCYLVAKRFLVKIVTFLQKGIYFFDIFIYNKNRKLVKNSRKDKKVKTETTSKTETTNKNSKWYNGKKTKASWRAIIGIATLIVVVSVSYSAYFIIMASSDTISRIMTIPMVIWASVQLIKQFLKQGNK